MSSGIGAEKLGFEAAVYNETFQKSDRLDFCVCNKLRFK